MPERLLYTAEYIASLSYAELQSLAEQHDIGPRNKGKDFLETFCR